MSDRATIETFEWAGIDSPLPINADDIDALTGALAWAKEQREHLDYENWLTSFEDEEDDDDIGFDDTDRESLNTFIAAVQRTIHTMSQHDRARLAAWNAGEPIREAGQP